MCSSLFSEKGASSVWGWCNFYLFSDRVSTDMFCLVIFLELYVSSCLFKNKVCFLKIIRHRMSVIEINS